MSYTRVRELWRRMSFDRSPMVGFLTVVLLGLTSLSAWFWSVAATVRAPITPGLAEAATFLPLVNGAAMWYLTKMPRGKSPAAGILTIFLIIVDTVIVTQSINNMPGSTVSCSLEKKWRDWFHAKDENSIRSVQDAFNCCGLNTPKDRAWPFPGPNSNATSCSTMFNRSKACFDPWSQSHRLSASMFLTVAIVTLLSKAVLLIAYRWHARKPSPSTQRLLGDGTTNDTHHNGSGRTSVVIAAPRARPDGGIIFTENDDDESDVDESSRLLNDSGRLHYETETPRQLENGERLALPAIDNSVWRDEPRTHPQS